MTTDDDAVRALAERLADHQIKMLGVEAEPGLPDEREQVVGWFCDALRAALPAYHAAVAAGGLEAAAAAVDRLLNRVSPDDPVWGVHLRAALAPHWPAEPSGDPGRLTGVREVLLRLVESIDALVAESEGVAGLHRNGDVAPWSELVEGGHYAAWLGDALGSARDALAAEPVTPADKLPGGVLAELRRRCDEAADAHALRASGFLRDQGARDAYDEVVEWIGALVAAQPEAGERARKAGASWGKTATNRALLDEIAQPEAPAPPSPPPDGQAEITAETDREIAESDWIDDIVRRLLRDASLIDPQSTLVAGNLRRLLRPAAGIVVGGSRPPTPAEAAAVLLGVLEAGGDDLIHRIGEAEIDAMVDLDESREHLDAEPSAADYSRATLAAVLRAIAAEAGR